MTIYDRIRARRIELNMSQEELANKLGYKTRSAINKIESGIRDISQSKIEQFAEALYTTPSYLMGWEANADSADTITTDSLATYDNVFPVNLKRFPVLGEIACGEPIWANEDRENYVMADMDIHADFCLIAKGDSMINARINNGDIVFIREMPIVENGEIAAVIIGDEATLKRWYYYREENKLMLVAENPKYPPLVYINEELDTIRCLGKAVYFMSAL